VAQRRRSGQNQICCFKRERERIRGVLAAVEDAVPGPKFFQHKKYFRRTNTPTLVLGHALGPYTSTTRQQQKDPRLGFLLPSRAGLSPQVCRQPALGPVYAAGRAASAPQGLLNLCDLRRLRSRPTPPTSIRVRYQRLCSSRESRVRFSLRPTNSELDQRGVRHIFCAYHQDSAVR